MSDIGETIEPEFEEMNQTYEKRFNDNKFKIEIKSDYIIFTLIKGLSYYKLIKEYSYDEIIKELDINGYHNLKEVYEYLIKSKYEINYEDKKIKINNKEINLIEKKLKNEELIEMLINEIKEIKKEKNNNNQSERIKKLMEANEEKDKRIEKLENDLNEIKIQIKELDNKKKDKDEINEQIKRQEESIKNIINNDIKIINDKKDEINNN